MLGPLRAYFSRFCSGLLLCCQSVAHSVCVCLSINPPSSCPPRTLFVPIPFPSSPFFVSDSSSILPFLSFSLFFFNSKLRVFPLSLFNNWVFPSCQAQTQNPHPLSPLSPIRLPLLSFVPIRRHQLYGTTCTRQRPYQYIQNSSLRYLTSPLHTTVPLKDTQSHRLPLPRKRTSF